MNFPTTDHHPRLYDAYRQLKIIEDKLRIIKNERMILLNTIIEQEKLHEKQQLNKTTYRPRGSINDL